MRRKIIFIVLLSSCAIGYACAESTDGVVPDGGTGSTDGGGGGEADLDSSPGKTDGALFIPDGDTSSSNVLINEIDPGDEWIELVNSGTAASDVSGYLLADRDKDTGEPKVAEAVTFPAGTILSPKSYLLVRGGGLDGGKPCPDGGQSYCFNAEFGVSRKNGETVFLLDPAKKAVGTVVYPPDGGGEGTWGRLPSGDPSGTFQPTRSTPGAPNLAP